MLASWSWLCPILSWKRAESCTFPFSRSTNQAHPLTKTHHLQRPTQIIPKLFTTYAHRYSLRPGGYTRVLRLEPLKDDQAPSALLELVDSPKDMRLALTAQTIARDRALNRPTTETTRLNERKVTQFREDGAKVLERLVRGAQAMQAEGVMGRRGEAPERKKLEGPGRGARHYPGGRRAEMGSRTDSRQIDTAGKYIGYNL